MSLQEKGRQSEQVAVDFLEQSGLEILERNVRPPGRNRGEIDLVAKEDGEIVFVEVKSAYSGNTVRPEDRVTLNKQRQLTKLAVWYLQTNKLIYTPARFDVVGITWTSGDPEIRWYPRAFEARYGRNR